MQLLEFQYNHSGSTISIRPNLDGSPITKHILKKLRTTLIVGPNGAGKSTMLSTLVRLFHHVDWHQNRIPCASVARYRLPTRADDLIIEYDGSRVELSGFGKGTRPIADSAVRRNKSFEEPFLSAFLPQVIASVFSTRGEYPKPKAPNYRGSHHSAVFEISEMYGKNHYRMGSLSNGLGRLLTDPYENARNCFKAVTGLEIVPYVKCHPTARLEHPNDVPEYENSKATPERIRKVRGWLDDDWIKFDLRVLRAEAEGLIYINDVSLRNKTNGDKVLSLMTLSAGQKMLFVRLVSILSKLRDGSLIVLEEPELHLDPIWCSGLLELFGAFFGNYDCHLFITTQNLSVTRCFTSESIILMQDHQPKTIEEQLFLASEAVIADKLFRSTSLSRLDLIVLNNLRHRNRQDRKLQMNALGEGPLRFIAGLDAENRRRRSKP